MPAKRQRQPTDAEMLRWLSRRGHRVVRDRMEFWPWTVIYGGIRADTEMQGPTLVKTIRSAMAAERKERRAR